MSHNLNAAFLRDITLYPDLIFKDATGSSFQYRTRDGDDKFCIIGEIACVEIYVGVMGPVSTGIRCGRILKV